MAVTADSVIVELEARTAGFTSSVQGAASAMQQSSSSIERSAARAEAAIRNTGNVVEITSRQQANSTRNLGRQIADVGTSLASGSSPFLILAQQAPQFADALADGQGRAARFAAFFAGPWGAALLAAGSILGVFIEKLLDASKAQKTLQEAAEAAAEAEQTLKDVLGGTIDQTENARIAALNLVNLRRLQAQETLNTAKAELRLAEAYLERQRAEAVGGRAQNFGANFGVQNRERDVARRQANVENAQSKIRALEIRLDRLQSLAGTARGVEQAKENKSAEREAAAARRKAEAEARRAEREARRAAEEEARNRRAFANDLARSKSELLGAEADLTADTRLQDQVLRDRIVNERDREKADIDANPAYNAAQREELKAIQDRIADAKLRRVNIEEAERYLSEELDLRSAGIRNQRDILQNEERLAETNQERRSIALRLVDLAYKQERAELEAVLASKQATDVQKQIAQQRLDLLDQLQKGDQAQVVRQTESPMERYRRQIFGDINDQLEEIEVRSMQRLEDSLVRATTKALGLKGALGDIVGELIRIGIQRQIIGPLADALFGAAGGGGGGIFSFIGRALGARASGGYVASGQMYRVNEGASPGRVEGFRPLGSGTIIPLGQMEAARRGAGTTIVQQFTLQAPNSILASELVDFIERRSREAAQAGAQGGYGLARRDIESMTRTRL